MRSRRLLQLIAASMVGFGISVASDIHAADWTNLDVHVPTQAVLGVALWACLRGRLRLGGRGALLSERLAGVAADRREI